MPENLQWVCHQFHEAQKVGDTLLLMEVEACIGKSVQVEVAMTEEIVEDLQVVEEMDFALKVVVEAVVGMEMIMVEVVVEGTMEVVVRWVEVELQEENQVAMVGNPQEKAAARRRYLKMIQRPHLN